MSITNPHDLNAKSKEQGKKASFKARYLTANPNLFPVSNQLIFFGDEK